MRITGGQWVNQSIAVPAGLGMRPTPDKVRQAIFNSLGPWVDGLSVLELFAGCGTLSFECLSRGAKSALAVELSSKHAGFIRRNSQRLNVHVEIRVQCALQATKRLAESAHAFDFICADPPYGEKTSLGQRSESWAQKLLDDSNLSKIMKPEGLLLLGHAKRDAVDWVSPWQERKTLKHGDTWIRMLELSPGA
ncbi:MAG: RsmD family RNA methyltransferase [Verrucomicrobiota bacterium]|jgi:16S rRNA (guanine(966)-N(2))-methyltransferase RsmD|nr:RsmD family RNA methyltransferase [Verrucomicrobiota bacterium]